MFACGQVDLCRLFIVDFIRDLLKIFCQLLFTFNALDVRDEICMRLEL